MEAEDGTSASPPISAHYSASPSYGAHYSASPPNSAPYSASPSYGAETHDALAAPGRRPEIVPEIVLADGRVVLRVTSACARCAMVEIDPTSGAKHGTVLRATLVHPV